jgi:hypothetical protein
LDDLIDLGIGEVNVPVGDLPAFAQQQDHRAEHKPARCRIPKNDCNRLHGLKGQRRDQPGVPGRFIGATASTAKKQPGKAGPFLRKKVNQPPMMR